MSRVSQAELQDHLRGLNFPVSKEQVKQYARKHGASEKIIGVIGLLPEKVYKSPVELSTALGSVEY